MIQVEHLTKRYGGHLAVDDISFTVEEGTIYGLLGPNGAGKSTTMNVLTGYISASAGTVTIDGHDILEDASAAKACVGYLPEQPPLYLDMTPWEYLNFVAELKKVKRAERHAQVEDAMERTGLQDMRNRLMKNLSKGYRQRVGFAAALLGSPKVIILDEPTVGLDPAQVIEIRSLIKELGRTHTVILSSHILSEVSALCDKVLIIANGKLVAQGTPEELSQQLTADATLNITALGDAPKILETVNTVEGVKQAQVEKEENGETSIVVTTQQGKDLRAAVSAALAAAGCPVLALNMASMTLEDVFLQITAQSEDADEPLTPDEKFIQEVAMEEESLPESEEQTPADAKTDEEAEDK